jgi:hypothetical protein
MSIIHRAQSFHMLDQSALSTLTLPACAWTAEPGKPPLQPPRTPACGRPKQRAGNLNSNGSKIDINAERRRIETFPAV